MRLDGLNNEMQAMMFEAMNTHPASTGQKVGADFGAMLTKAINNVNGLQRPQVICRRVLIVAMKGFLFLM